LRDLPLLVEEQHHRDPLSFHTGGDLDRMLVELAPFELWVSEDRVRHPGDLGEVAKRLPAREFATMLALHRQAEQAHLEQTLAAVVAVGDPQG